jgi:uncharacterized membrane protein YkoI
VATLSKLKFLAMGCCFAIGGCATSPRHIEPYRDVSCFGRAAIPLVDAIAAAETSLHQTVIDAEYNIESEMACVEGDPGHYDITFYVNGELKRATVDARSGEVGPGHYEGFLHRVFELEVLSDWPEAEMLKGGPAAKQARTPMREAVRVAEARGGNAMAAHVKTENNKTSYVIELVSGGQIRLVVVDPETAAVRDG